MDNLKDDGIEDPRDADIEDPGLLILGGSDIWGLIVWQ